MPDVGQEIATHVVLRLLWWNAGFIACLASPVVRVDRGTSDAIGLSLPCIAGLWILLLGARFEKGRAAVIAIAKAAGFLLPIQSMVPGFFVWYKRGVHNAERATRFGLGNTGLTSRRSVQGHGTA